MSAPRGGRGRGRVGGRVRDQTPEVSQQAENPIPPEMAANFMKAFMTFMGQMNATLQGAALASTVVQPVEDHVRLSSLTRELKWLGAQDFQGEPDHVKADQWIRDLENLFELVSCNGVDKRIVASHFLKGEARCWWDSVKRTRDVTELTWEQFKEKFDEKFFPASIKEKLEVEFLELKQGVLTVREYEAKFAQLSHFAPEMDEQRRARKLERGLDPIIRQAVVSHRFKTYAEVVDCALTVETDKGEYRKMNEEVDDDSRGKGSLQEYFKDSSNKQEMTEKLFQNERHDGQPWKRQRSDASASRMVTSPLQSVVPRKFNGNCFNCGDKGHVSRECTKPRRDNRQVQTHQNNPRMYAMVQEDAKRKGIYLRAFDLTYLV